MDPKKLFSISTTSGTNYISAILAVLTFSEAFPPETKQWFTPLCLGLLAIIFWLIRGYTPPAEGQPLEGGKTKKLEDVVQEGRD